MFVLPSERTRQIYARLESWERLRATPTLPISAADLSDASPNSEPPMNSAPDLPTHWNESRKVEPDSTSAGTREK